MLEKNLTWIFSFQAQLLLSILQWKTLWIKVQPLNHLAVVPGNVMHHKQNHRLVVHSDVVSVIRCARHVRLLRFIIAHILVNDLIPALCASGPLKEKNTCCGTWVHIANRVYRCSSLTPHKAKQHEGASIFAWLWCNNSFDNQYSAVAAIYCIQIDFCEWIFWDYILSFTAKATFCFSSQF